MIFDKRADRYFRKVAALRHGGRVPLEGERNNRLTEARAAASGRRRQRQVWNLRGYANPPPHDDLASEGPT